MSPPVSLTAMDADAIGCTVGCVGAHDVTYANNARGCRRPLLAGDECHPVVMFDGMDGMAVRALATDPSIPKRVAVAGHATSIKVTKLRWLCFLQVRTFWAGKCRPLAQMLSCAWLIMGNSTGLGRIVPGK